MGDMDDNVYIAEFEYKDCAPGAAPEEKRQIFEKALEEGLSQIKGKDYADKYAGSGKTVYQAAFAFLGRDEIAMRIGS